MTSYEFNRAMKSIRISLEIEILLWIPIHFFYFKQTISLKLDPRFFVSGVTEVEGDINWEKN